MQVRVGGQCHLFDTLQISRDVMLQLKYLLEDNSIMKVVHDCRQDSAALFHQKGIRLRNNFDTQVCIRSCRSWSCLFPALIKSLTTSLPGELRLSPQAPSLGWHALLSLDPAWRLFCCCSKFKQSLCSSTLACVLRSTASRACKVLSAVTTALAQPLMRLSA